MAGAAPPCRLALLPSCLHCAPGSPRLLPDLASQPPSFPPLHRRNAPPAQGTEKTEESLNIFLEYVPGGSIASLLAKFGSFKESVIRVYTKQILLGLEYLHRWVLRLSTPCSPCLSPPAGCLLACAACL